MVPVESMKHVDMFVSRCVSSDLKDDTRRRPHHVSGMQHRL